MWAAAIVFMVGVALALAWLKLDRDESKLESIFAEVSMGMSLSKVVDLTDGMTRSSVVQATNSIVSQRYHYGLLSHRYLLLVTQSNAVCHVSIRSWDRFDKVFLQKGVEVAYPGIPQP